MPIDKSIFKRATQCHNEEQVIEYTEKADMGIY